MKKLLFYSLFTIMIFSFMTVKNEVEADEFNNIDWTCDATFDPEFALIGDVYFGTFATEVIVNIPKSNLYLRDNGAYIFSFKFYDSNGLQVDGFETNDFFGNYFGNLDELYHVNFNILDIDSTAVSMEVIIPQDFADTTGNICPVGYETYINENSYAIINYDQVDFGNLRFKYVDHVIPTNYMDWVESDYALYPVGSEYLQIYTTYLRTVHYDDDFAEVVFYDVDYIELDRKVLMGNRGVDNKTFIWRTEDILNSESVVYFTVNFLTTRAYSETIYSVNAFTVYTGDQEFTTVNFYDDDGTLLFTHKTVVGAIARYAIIYPEGESGYEFSYWTQGDGALYNFTPITEAMLINNTVNFYANFSKIPSYIVGDVVDFTADENSQFTTLMTTMGFNDPIERTIIFGFLAIITAIALMYKGVSTFATLMVVGIELIFFMFLGVIPLFASVIIIIVLVFIGIGASGGVSNG